MELLRFSALAEKERSQYNEGLQREGYDLFFSHCRHFYIQRRNKLVKEKVQFAHDKNVLEIKQFDRFLLFKYINISLYTLSMQKYTDILVGMKNPFLHIKCIQTLPAHSHAYIDTNYRGSTA